jgi:hypothetical protein
MINKTEKLKNLLKIEVPLSSVKVGTYLCCVKGSNGEITCGKSYRVEFVEFVKSCAWITIIDDKDKKRECFFTYFNIIERNQFNERGNRVDSFKSHSTIGDGKN